MLIITCLAILKVHAEGKPRICSHIPQLPLISTHLPTSQVHAKGKPLAPELDLMIAC